MPLLFLGVDEILEIHRDQIERYGGKTGVRDMGLLQSAVAMPEAGAGGTYFHADLFEMAAAYLFHIVRNHPFVDGDKRVGAMAAFTFLRLNGVTVRATNPAFERLVLSTVAGDADKAAISVFLRKHSRLETRILNRTRS